MEILKLIIQQLYNKVFYNGEAFESALNAALQAANQPNMTADYNTSMTISITTPGAKFKLYTDREIPVINKYWPSINNNWNFATYNGVIGSCSDHTQSYISSDPATSYKCDF